MDYGKKSLEMHKKHTGKLSISPDVSLDSVDDLSTAYTPGVAEPCRVIAEDPTKARELTIKGRAVAVVTDGSAVLGLGNIGPEAAMPVMEGKAILFKAFANVDAYPICLDTQDADEIVETVKHISPGFAAINLEDIGAPSCFRVLERLERGLSIPVMHDDQHGTAVVILAGLMNALKVVQKNIGDVNVVIAGAGAAGLATAELLWDAGVRHMSVTDSRGILAAGRKNMNEYKTRIATRINPEDVHGDLADAMQGADVFIGVSQPNIVDEDMIRSMNEKPIVFAMSNPVPEVMPDVAEKAGAAVIATGRSDFPNQINNVLAFPGMFRGVIDANAPKFTKEMRVAAAEALAGMIENPMAEKIIPSPLNKDVAPVVAEAVKKVA